MNAKSRLTKSRLRTGCALGAIAVTIIFISVVYNPIRRGFATLQLEWAALDDDASGVEDALRYGANPNDGVKDYDESVGTLPVLEKAARTDAVNAVRVLLRAGADPNCPGVPLVSAAAHGDYEMCELLLQAGANPNAEYDGVTPLSHAIWNKDEDLQRLLRKYGAKR